MTGDRASDDVLRIVHAFGDVGRKSEVRELARRVRAVEDERDEWRKLAGELRTQESLVSGALCDAATVHVDDLAQGVRELTAERDQLRELLDGAALRIRELEARSWSQVPSEKPETEAERIRRNMLRWAREAKAAKELAAERDQLRAQLNEEREVCRIHLEARKEERAEAERLNVDVWNEAVERCADELAGAVGNAVNRYAVEEAKILSWAEGIVRSVERRPPTADEQKERGT